MLTQDSKCVIHAVQVKSLVEVTTQRPRQGIWTVWDPESCVAKKIFGCGLAALILSFAI